MRYFTMAWWRGDREDEGYDPVADHARHLDAIRHLLPPDLVAVHETVPLHDGRVQALVILPAAGTVRLVLDAYSGRERFTLTYGGVERVESTVGPKGACAAPLGMGTSGTASWTSCRPGRSSTASCSPRGSSWRSFPATLSSCGPGSPESVG